MPSIGDFVNALAKDDALAKKFDKRPKTTMKAFGLTPAQIKKILEGDIIGLRKQIENDLSPKKPLVFRVKRG